MNIFFGENHYKSNGWWNETFIVSITNDYHQKKQERDLCGIKYGKIYYNEKVFQRISRGKFTMVVHMLLIKIFQERF